MNRRNGWSRIDILLIIIAIISAFMALLISVVSVVRQTVKRNQSTEKFEEVFGVKLPSTHPNKEETEIIQSVIDQKLKELAENWGNSINNKRSALIELQSERTSVSASPVTNPSEAQNKLDQLKELDEKIKNTNETYDLSIMNKLKEFIDARDLARLYYFSAVESPDNLLRSGERVIRDQKTGIKPGFYIAHIHQPLNLSFSPYERGEGWDEEFNVKYLTSPHTLLHNDCNYGFQEKNDSQNSQSQK